jgi:hypothetical protein
MDENDDRVDTYRENAAWKWGLCFGVLALFLMVCVGLAYLSRERRQISDLTAFNQSLNSSVAQLRAEMRVMAERLPQTSAADSSARVVAQGEQRGVLQRRQTTRAGADPRYTQLQRRLSNQEKELGSTREDLTKTRDDLQGKLNSTRDELSGSLSSTRDELSGSIGRTHDEVVSLQKRGERNYHEFQLPKSKEFHRVGSLSLSLRKVNTRRKSYDLALFVDDNHMQKKSVNLYEPVWINLDGQPVELVVNQIGKNQIRGYVSEPKYKKSDLGDTAAAHATEPGFKQE